MKCSTKSTAPRLRGAVEVFLSLGGNVGDVTATMKRAEEEIRALPVHDLRFSRLYRTSPVSDIPQADYINCACQFYTDLPATELLEKLQEIERKLGKVPKPKNAPRPIDIDILFYGNEIIHTATLDIPHPQWQERLFVLVPLSDLVDIIGSIDIKKRIQELREKL